LVTPEGPLLGRFVVGAFWSVAGALISRGFLLAASVVCAWFLGKEGFGALGMIQSTTGMLGVLAGLGLGITATKYVSELRRHLWRLARGWSFLARLTERKRERWPGSKHFKRSRE